MNMGADISKLWAKKSADSDNRYPLLSHMLDTSAVCEEIWQSCLQAGMQQFMANELAMPEKAAKQWVSFLAGLHDIGKASPGFQNKIAVAVPPLKEAGFDFKDVRDIPHGIVSACTLNELLQHTFQRRTAAQLAFALGGHHGVVPTPRTVQDNIDYIGGQKWRSASTTLYTDLMNELGLQETTSKVAPSNAFYMILAGLTSVADWVSSNEEFFPYVVDEDIANARKQACNALDKLGWTGWAPAHAALSIQDMFPFITEVRPLQQEVAFLINKPGLAIIEAPMGEGKTEAAIYLADNWLTLQKQRGYYFALPTMATSDQMFGRVEDYLTRRYPDDRVNFMLLHGHAALSAEFQTLQDRFHDRFNINSDSSSADKFDASVIAASWFTQGKRGLLAPFGVGTIDQALLAILQTKHVFVRLFGLAHKTVIIDEVHAYDTYMTNLLSRLLEWLAALGSNVILLSATLPTERRNLLLEEYAKGLGSQEVKVPPGFGSTYPRISWTAGNQFYTKAIKTSPGSTRELQIRIVDNHLPVLGGEYDLGKQLSEALADGGCASIICNTVSEAQATFQALRPYFPNTDAGDGAPELDILHSRYLYHDRKQREERTLIRFGKPGGKVLCSDGIERTVNRPRRALLVATQIIEQSLDLDFDLMVSEVAPIDFLLQRSGRMHRHDRDTRPPKLKTATFWIGRPEIKTGDIPDFGRDRFVYDYHVLLRSWLAISKRTIISIPQDVDSLIDAVYGEHECPNELSQPFMAEWAESRKKQLKDIEHDEIEADNRNIEHPDFGGYIGYIAKDPKEEDDPTVHQAHQALTRLTMPTANVICLHGSREEAFWDLEQTLSLNLGSTPDRATVKKLLEHSLTISRYDLVMMLTSSPITALPSAWKNVSLLYNYNVLFFNSDNESHFRDFHLELSELGLIIQKLN
jgi:CRISPR-associated endonuclease/helicase Cas3